MHSFAISIQRSRSAIFVSFFIQKGLVMILKTRKTGARSSSKMATLGKNYFCSLFSKFQLNKSVFFQKFIRGSCCLYATNAGKSATMMMNENQRNRTWSTKRQQTVSQGIFNLFLRKCKIIYIN